MKKLLIGILLCFMLVSTVHAETFTEAAIAGDGVPGVVTIEIRQDYAEGTTVTVRGRTVDASGNGIRGVSKDITSTLNAGQLTAIQAILTKGLSEAKTHANIP